MGEQVYVCPTGLVAGIAARAAVAAGQGRWLAGGGLAFTAALVREGRRSDWRHLSMAALEASDDAAIAGWLARLSAPRPAFAGLAMEQAHVMGIVNVTPDSFSDGGVHGATDVAIDGGRAMAAAGAAILDIGGELTRPGSDAVTLEEELARVIPVITALAGEGWLISTDTRKAAVIEAAAGAGAGIVNDVSALTFDDAAAARAARLRLPVVLMHAQGDPKTMQHNPVYEDVLLDVYDWLEARVAAAEAAGIARTAMAVDPGIGFGKTFEHNLQLMHGLALFHGLGLPVVFGASRKGFIGSLTGVKEARWRQAGSVAAALHAVAAGAQIVRVHDVTETVQALKVWQAAQHGRQGTVNG